MYIMLYLINHALTITIYNYLQTSFLLVDPKVLFHYRLKRHHHQYYFYLHP